MWRTYPEVELIKWSGNGFSNESPWEVDYCFCCFCFDEVKSFWNWDSESWVFEEVIIFIEGNIFNCPEVDLHLRQWMWSFHVSIMWCKSIQSPSWGIQWLRKSFALTYFAIVGIGFTLLVFHKKLSLSKHSIWVWV